MVRLKTLRPQLAEPERLRAAPPLSWRAGKSGANARGYTYVWQKARERFLRQNPLCQCPDCDEGRKRARPALVVDHKTPHRGDERLFWDEANWQAMAKECHDAKTQRELQEEAKWKKSE